MVTVWCVVTADSAEINDGSIFRLLDSIDSSSCRVVAVLRDATDDQATDISRYQFVESIIRTEPMGPSSARNVGMSELFQLQPGDSDLVCFPDDDSYFWPGVIKDLILAADRLNADFIGGRYSESPPSQGLTRNMRGTDALLRISAVCIYLRVGLLRKVGWFNTELGGGPSARFNYGEDNDFALRAWKRSSRAFLVDEICVFHLENTGVGRRNPKGYLTIAALNLTAFASWLMLFRGVLGALARDIFNFPERGFENMKKVSAALAISGLRIAAQARAQEIPYRESR